MKGIISLMELAQRRREIARITTSAPDVDDLLQGGLETWAITELYGKTGAGKTEMAQQLAVNCMLSVDSGGLDGHTAIIDTEGKIRPERMNQMVKSHGLDPAQVFPKIHYTRACSVDDMFDCLVSIREKAAELGIRLLIVDSLINHFRYEYTTRSALPTRQSRIFQFMRSLQSFTEEFNAAVLITNHVQTRPDVFYDENPVLPLGGNVVGHLSTIRLYVRQVKGDLRIIRLVSSPSYPEGEAIFTISNDGIR